VDRDETNQENTLEIFKSKLQPLLEINIEGILEAEKLGKVNNNKKRLLFSSFCGEDFCMCCLDNP
jgi:hypothetical protein